MSSSITTDDIKVRKNDNKAIVCLTAYTAPMAQILDQYCDLILVGDSMSMCLYGMNSTVGLSLDTIINHGRAVASHCENACVVVDMPYGSYEDCVETALENAQRIMKETGCGAVKLEGGQDMEQTIRAIVNAGIPVMAHIGLQPQSVEKDGGYRVKGKTEEEALALIEDVQAVERAGAFCVVIEGTIERVAAKITNSTSIPTIGIGGSVECDGQILVTEDMLGMLSGHTPKFAKKFANLSDHIHKAVQDYASDVKSRAFPTDEYTYQGKK